MNFCSLASRLCLTSLLALCACSKGKPSPAAKPQSGAPPDAAVVDKSISLPDTPCAPAPASGFGTPEEAYARYAQLMNAGKWCEAIQAYAPEARPELALTTFKGLAAVAYSSHPRQREYDARFQLVCRKHKLGCDNDQAAEALGNANMNGIPVENELPALATLARERPEQLYTDVMTSLMQGNEGALNQLDTTLRDVQMQGERATGNAHLKSGIDSPLQFAKNPTGWQLVSK